MLTVSQLTDIIYNKFQDNISNQYFTVSGEIQSFSDKGHWYFYLSDLTSDNILSCIVWKTNTKNIIEDNNTIISNGDKVIVKGKLSVYKKLNKYSLHINKLLIESSEESVFDKLYKYYENLGYYKKKLSYNKKDIKNVGIITSLQGEAINDFTKTLNNRLFFGNIYKYDVNVQGINCAQDIINAINYFEKTDYVDIILITRGGGSKLDLNEFNNQKLIEKIYNRKKPIICAIGHERDYSLCDYVCDLRSSTPTSLALEISQDNNILIEKMVNIYNKQKLEYERYKNMKQQDFIKYRNKLYTDLLNNKAQGFYISDKLIYKLNEFEKLSKNKMKIKLEDAIIEIELSNYKVLKKLNKNYLYSVYEKEYNIPTYKIKKNDNIKRYLDLYSNYDFGTKDHFYLFKRLNKMLLENIKNINDIDLITEVQKNFDINIDNLIEYKKHINFLKENISENFENFTLAKIKFDIDIYNNFLNYNDNITENFINIYLNLLKMKPKYYKIK